jgi:hypothetical protein
MAIPRLRVGRATLEKKVVSVHLIGGNRTDADCSLNGRKQNGHRLFPDTACSPFNRLNQN